MPSEAERDILKEWRESASYWATHADTVRQMFRPITRALMETGGIREGHSVLDVAGGSGEPSIALSEALGSGSVVCTDAVLEMVTTARSQSRAIARTNIDFCQCRAESLPFTDNRFDTVVCRLGVMLFPAPAAAISEMLRVVNSAGRVSCAVWLGRDSNPFFDTVAGVMERFVDTPVEDPDAPGAFRFAEPGKLARLFTDSGALEVTEQRLEFLMESPLRLEQFWRLRVDLSDTLRTKVSTLSSSQLNEAMSAVEEAGRPYFTSGQMSFPAQVLIVTARKP